MRDAKIGLTLNSKIKNTQNSFTLNSKIKNTLLKYTLSNKFMFLNIIFQQINSKFVFINTKNPKWLLRVMS